MMLEVKVSREERVVGILQFYFCFLAYFNHLRLTVNSFNGHLSSTRCGFIGRSVGSYIKSTHPSGHGHKVSLASAEISFSGG